MLCPEADGIVGGQACFVGDVRYRAPRVVVAAMPDVFSAIHATFAFRAGNAIRSWSSTSSGAAESVPRAPLDLGRAGRIEHEEMRRRAVDEPERDLE